MIALVRQGWSRCGHGALSQELFLLLWQVSHRLLVLGQIQSLLKLARSHWFSVVQNCSLSTRSLFSCSFLIVHLCSSTNVFFLRI